MIYGLGDRNEDKEMRIRYDKMIHALSVMFNCGIWDIEDMFDSRKNIDVGNIVKDYVDEIGVLPTNNSIFHEAMLIFASEHGLEIGTDIDIYTNSCLDTHIYARDSLSTELKEELENIYGIDVEELAD